MVLIRSNSLVSQLDMISRLDVLNKPRRLRRLQTRSWLLNKRQRRRTQNRLSTSVIYFTQTQKQKEPSTADAGLSLKTAKFITAQHSVCCNGLII